MRPSVQRHANALFAPARVALGSTEWERAVAAGGALPLDDALSEARSVATALQDASENTALGSQRHAAPHVLTPREVDVLRLLVAGRSDRQIGTELFIGHRTAQDHVSNVIAKLGVANRTEAAAVAVRDGLV